MNFTVISNSNNHFSSIFQLWQAFVGVKVRRVDNYYQDLLAAETKAGSDVEQHSLDSEINSKMSTTDSAYVPEKWKGQIEKVICFYSVFAIVYEFLSNQVLNLLRLI